MSLIPVLDLAAQYWQGTRTLPRDYDVLDRLRKAISDMPPEDSEMQEEPETPNSEAAETGGDEQTWSSDEDRKLKKLAKTYGCDWEQVSVQIPRHSATACQARWEKKYSCKAEVQSWQPHEDSLLLALHSKIGPNWKDISDRLPGRSPSSLQHRFLHLDSSLQPASQSVSTATAEESQAKVQQIELMRRNALRLEEKIKRYKEELGRLEMDLDASQL